MMARWATLGSVCLLAMTGPTAAAPDGHRHHAHVHGLWQMFAAMDDNRLSITVEGPLVDLLGYEHVPETKEERAALSRLKEALATPMVELDDQASCGLTDEIDVQWPDGFEDGAADRGNDHDHMGDDNGHDRERDGHTGDLALTYRFRCGSPETLGWIRYTGFASYPAVQDVEAVFVGDQGQNAARLSPSTPKLSID